MKPSLKACDDDERQYQKHHLRRSADLYTSSSTMPTRVETASYETRQGVPRLRVRGKPPPC